jgi:hypothetical protein
MSEAAEQISILNAVKALWDVTTMGPLQYPNLPTPAAPGNGLPRTTVTISHPQDGREKADIGDRDTAFSIGLLVFVIHLPIDSGTLRARRIIDILAKGRDAIPGFDRLALTTEVGDIIKFGLVSSQDLGGKDSTHRISAIVRFRRQEMG